MCTVKILSLNKVLDDDDDDDGPRSILCMVCSKSTGDSCADCKNQSVRSALGTWSTGMAFRRYEDACVPSSDACV